MTVSQAPDIYARRPARCQGCGTPEKRLRSLQVYANRWLCGTCATAASDQAQRDQAERRGRNRPATDELDTSEADTAWGLHTGREYIAEPPGWDPSRPGRFALSVKATLGPRGKPIMKEGWIDRMEGKERIPRDHVSIKELATALAWKENLIEEALKKKALTSYQPSGKDGRHYIEVRVAEAYITGLPFTLEKRTEALENIQRITSAQR